jgi:hypothetical protein
LLGIKLGFASKSHIMKNIKFPIYFVTAVLFAYSILSQFYPDSIVIVMVFALSPFLITWMVYKVLKDGQPSARTFDEYFYDDIDIRRLTVKEASEYPDYFKTGDNDK